MLAQKVKIGDKVKFVKSVANCAPIYNLTLGKIYTIISVNKMKNGCSITNDVGREWYIQDNAFEPYKKELLSEIDYLDSFKENFKDGI